MNDNFSLENSGIVNMTVLNNDLRRNLVEYCMVDHENVPHLFMVLNFTVNIILMIISILTNILVITAVWKTPSLRYPSILLLCGLAMSDVTVGLVVEPLFIALELLLLRGYQDTDVCRLETVFIFSAYFVCGVSILNVLLTNVDRFLAIHYPLRYDTIVTVPRVFSLIISCWLISALGATLWLWHETAFEYVVNAFMIAFVSTSTVIQIMIYRVVRRHRREIHAQEEAIRIKHHFNMRHFIKSCMNTIFVYYLLIFCYLPFLVAKTVYSVSKGNISSPIVWKLAHTAVFLNSALNPFLYCWRLQDIRNPVKLLLRKILCPNRVASALNRSV